MSIREQKEYDEMFEEEREMMAELEYSDPLFPTEDEEEQDIIECTCILNDGLPCPIHDKLDEEI